MPFFYSSTHKQTLILYYPLSFPFIRSDSIFQNISRTDWKWAHGPNRPKSLITLFKSIEGAFIEEFQKVETGFSN